MKNLRFGHLAALALAWIGFSSCGSEDPTRPALDFADATPASSSVVSQTIGSAGGVLVHPQATVSVSSGSFISSTTVSVSTNSENSEVVIDADASSFPGQAELAMERPAGSGSSDVYEILEYDPFAGTWIQRGGVPSGNTISIVIDHPATFVLELSNPD